ncbi:MAG: DUF423 domain-containing protein [Rhodospirillaceae bacterium]|jgi:uncharacterized membrane protein YgdD (TMEM256/DUF423 family)|nr:DUF423 domain-containing protein [Rhodospirillaceae bacterium]MBT6117370.1 DUF423 domain-containing protein [Rhodospirillaceae bacterium]
MWRYWLALAGVNGALAVALGAAGAHAFAATPEAERLFATAQTYHLWHVPALLAVAWLAERGLDGRARMLPHLAGTAFLLGILLFSGSLYLKAWTGAAPVPPLVPLGGLAFLLGWLILVAAGLGGKRRIAE